MKTIWCGVLAFLLIGCLGNRKSPIENFREQKITGEELFEKIELHIQEGELELAEKKLQEGFNRKDLANWNESFLLLKSDLALLGGRINEAENILKGIRNRQALRHSFLATLAEWRLSFVTEARGDDGQTLLHLQSVLLRQADLPAKVRLAELPARFAMIYYRLGQSDKALVYAEEADRGLIRLMSGYQLIQNEPGWKARLYFEMGRSVALDISGDDFIAILRSQKVSQRYLLKSIEENIEPWSKWAYQQYRDQIMSLVQSLESFSSRQQPNYIGIRPLREALIQRGAAVLEVLAEAQMRDLSHISMSQIYERKTHEFIAEVIKKVQTMTHSHEELMPLTETPIFYQVPSREKK